MINLGVTSSDMNHQQTLNLAWTSPLLLQHHSPSIMVAGV